MCYTIIVFLYTYYMLVWFVKVLGIAFLLVASLLFALLGSSMKDHVQRERNREDIAEGVRRGRERSRRGYRTMVLCSQCTSTTQMINRRVPFGRVQIETSVCKGTQSIIGTSG